MVNPSDCPDLVTYRVRKGLTLRQLSELTGLSPATLHRIEQRKSSLTPRSRILLQQGLQLSVEEFERLAARSGLRTARRQGM
ncbi:MAG: helix-turn-helix domain-containing protein [Planctomycetota bacterium]|nr:helix-turn-helix domain-containing protein [Planctomycetota bacterium]